VDCDPGSIARIRDLPAQFWHTRCKEKKAHGHHSQQGAGAVARSGASFWLASMHENVSDHTIEIDKFVPLAEIDSRYFDSPYYIIPNDDVGLDAFAVIRQAMAAQKMVGIGHVVLQKRERPIMLEPFGKGLRGMTLRYPYEVRSEAEYFGDLPDVKIAPDMLDLAKHIVSSKAGHFEPAEFVDHYEAEVVELIKKKQAGRPTKKDAMRAATPKRGANIIDLLKRSLKMESKRRPKVKAPPLAPGKAKPSNKKRVAS
jgi:DNA end-binding protein Ku